MPLVPAIQRPSKNDPPVGTLVLAPSLRQASRKSRHNKVRSGCSTCKLRKVKCDETKPECLRCLKAGKICEGYEEIKTWLFETHNQLELTPLGGHSTVHHLPEGRASNHFAATQDKYKAEEGDMLLESTSIPFHSIPAWPTFIETCMPFLKENYAQKAPLPVSMLFDFIIHHFGPVCIWRPHHGVPIRDAFKADFLHCMFREPALLEAMFCAALRTLEVCPSHGVFASKESKQHYGKSLSLLRHRVSDPLVVFDDAIFWAIGALMLYDLDRRNWESFLVNLDGIRRIISLRGGKPSGQVLSTRPHSFHQWAEKCYADRNETTLTAVPFVILTPHDGVRPGTTISPHVSDPLDRLRNYATFCPEGIRSMQLGNMLEPESVNSIARFLAWYNAYTAISAADRRSGKIAGDRTSLLFELHQLLSRGILGARSRVVCLAMFAITLMVHPIFTGPGFVGTFSGDMTDFSYISTVMLSEDYVIWLALVLAPMHTFFFIDSEERHKLLHMVATHRKGSASWADVLNKVRRFIAPKNLLVDWESCWHSATQASPQSP